MFVTFPAAVGDMKMLLIRRCPKDPNRKQRVPFLVSRRRLQRALDRLCRTLEEDGSLALQPGALTPGGYVDLVKRGNLDQYADTEEARNPMVCKFMSFEQRPWERVERKLFALWMSCSLELQMAAQVRLLHEPEDVQESGGEGGCSVEEFACCYGCQSPGCRGRPFRLDVYNAGSITCLCSFRIKMCKT